MGEMFYRRNRGVTPTTAGFLVYYMVLRNVMGERITGNFDQDEVDAFSELKEERGIEHMSEAVRIASRTGLQQLGYVSESGRDTTLRQTSRRFADAFALVALIMVGLTWAYPIGLRILVVGPLAASMSCYGLDRALKHYEPAISKRIAGLFGGETA